MFIVLFCDGSSVEISVEVILTRTIIFSLYLQIGLASYTRTKSSFIQKKRTLLTNIFILSTSSGTLSNLANPAFSPVAFINMVTN